MVQHNDQRTKLISAAQLEGCGDEATRQELAPTPKLRRVAVRVFCWQQKEHSFLVLPALLQTRDDAACCGAAPATNYGRRCCDKRPQLRFSVQTRFLADGPSAKRYEVDVPRVSNLELTATLRHLHARSLKRVVWSRSCRTSTLTEGLVAGDVQRCVRRLQLAANYMLKLEVFLRRFAMF